MKLFLLQDYKADEDKFQTGQVFQTSDEEEAKDLLFKGVARLATDADERSQPDKPGLTKEDVAKIVGTTIADLFEAEHKKARRADPDVAAVTQTADDSKPFKSFGEQLKAVMIAGGPSHEIDSRLNAVTKASGLSEGIPSDAGFLVQQDFATELLKLTYDTGLLVPRCRRLPISGNSNGIKVNAIDETSRATGSRWGGIRGYWKDEAATKTASAPKFRQVVLDLKKLTGLCYATDELLQDTVALESLLMQGFAEEFGFMLDDAIVNGTGAGQPLGILNAACTVSQAKETLQGATTFVAENAEKMWSRLWARSMPNAAWLISQGVWPQIFQFYHAVGTAGVPLYIEPGRITDAPFGAILGRPILPIEQCAALGTVGDVILADLSQYLLIDKGGIQAQSSIHVRFLYDETVFRFVYRVDGQPTWASPLTPYTDTAKTQSPFITLATRA